MKPTLKGRWKLLIIFGILFLTICILLLLIFYQGKKTYTVTFDLDGGILLSGSVEQRITQGQNATPPNVAKEGAYLRGWNASYQRITGDMVIKAIWEYETTVGIIYSGSSNQNFTEIVGSHPYISGDVYLGAYYDNKKILSICDEAFMDRTRIEKVYLLNGITFIGERAFAGCKGLTEITIPETVVRIGKEAFKNCSSLEVLVLNEGLKRIEAGAFENCENLKTVVLPESLVYIEPGAFDGCHDLVITVKLPDGKMPALWMKGWQGPAQIDWFEAPNMFEDFMDTIPPTQTEEPSSSDDSSESTDETDEGDGSTEPEETKETDGGN